METNDEASDLVELVPESERRPAHRTMRGLRPYSGEAQTAVSEELAQRLGPEEATDLFDVQSGFGGAAKGEATAVSLAECLRAMAELRIRRAVVRVEPDAMVVDVPLANELLFEACAGSSALLPCPILLPAGGGDVPPEEVQVDDAIRHGAAAAAIRPGQDDWQFLPFVYDPLLRALAERRLPLFCLERYVSVPQVAEAARRYPELPVILANVAYRSQRTLVPLLATFPNVYLSLGSNWTVHRGIEQMVERVGPQQLLFGTGFPAAEPMMAVTQLMYAEIAPEARALIGAGNLERLLAGIRR